MRPVIWCDFGGVISPGVEDSSARVAAALGVPWVAVVRAADRVARRWGQQGLRPLELGLVDHSHWVRLMTAELRRDHQLVGSLSDLAAVWYDGRTVDLELLEALTRWRRSGVAVGLLTNSMREWEVRRAEMLGTSDRFDAVVRSHEVGLAKPDPEIYRLAERRLGGPASWHILIDDLAENCAAAEGRGWLGVVHRETSATLDLVDAALQRRTRPTFP